MMSIGIFLPALLITALLLWRRKLLGSLLGGALLVFCTLMETVILCIFLVMSSKGMPTSIGIEIFFALIIGVTFLLSVLFIQKHVGTYSLFH